MPKHLIVLYGKGNCGKTSTLKYLIKLLDSEYPIDGGDKVAVFPCGNHKIGISTGGDNGNIIKKNVQDKLFIAEKCDIVITAARSHGSTHNVISNIKAQISPCVVDWFKQIDYCAESQPKSSLGERTQDIRKDINQKMAALLKEHIVERILETKDANFTCINN